MTIVAILLAAGRSTRFGEADKLLEPFEGLPLALHAGQTLLRVPVTLRIVVTGPASLPWPGFERVLNERPEAGMSRSLALGIAAARRSGASAALIALADMPLVTVEHFGRLLDHHRGASSLAASSDGERRMPPALIGADFFPALQQRSGDRGARDLLDHAEIVLASRSELADIDYPRDLNIRART